MPLEWLSDALAFVQSKIDELSQIPKIKALDEGPHATMPFWISYAKRRNFAKAAKIIKQSTAEALNQGSLLSEKLNQLADEIAQGFAPIPNTCRAASLFDLLISHHTDGMKKQASIILNATFAFDSHCAALSMLVRNLLSSSPEAPSYRIRVLEQDGRAYILEK